MYPKGWASERYPEVVTFQSSIFRKCLDVSKQHNNETEQEIVSYLNEIVSGGKEICTDMCLNWTYPSYAAILAMSKYNSNIWSKLSQSTKDKLDLLARCMLIAVAAIASDQNKEFHTGFGFNGNESVTWSPNHRVALVAPYLFLQQFFDGVQNTNSILQNFDYDTYLSEIRAAGFSNIEQVWTTVKKDLNGDDFGTRELLTYEPQNEGDYLEVQIQGPDYNPLYFGKYKGIKRPFTYEGWDGENLLWILLNHCFIDTIHSECTVNGIRCYISDKSKTPYENKPGINRELILSFRSCIKFAAIANFMLIEILAASLALNFVTDSFLDLNDGYSIARYYMKMYYGTQDVFYKLDHGYKGVNLFDQHTYSYNHLAFFFPQLRYDRQIWENMVKEYGVIEQGG